MDGRLPPPAGVSPAAGQTFDRPLRPSTIPPDAMQDAIRFAIDHETLWSREIGPQWGIHHLDPPPWNRLRGPVHDRGPVSGTVLLDGQTIASWGEPDRADLTFSVAKTYLAILAGIAHDRGLLARPRRARWRAHPRHRLRRGPQL